MPHSEGQIYDKSSYIRDYDVSGIVEECDENGNAWVCQRNKFSVGDELEILRPKGDFLRMTVEEMYNEKGERIESAPHATMKVRMRLPQYTAPNSMLRHRRKS